MVRGRFLALREEDFVTAAELAGASRMRIIFRHMVPSFLSHIIAAISLALPAMIISETTLSFLGLGLRPPAISWGVLLQDAQNVQTLGLAPWLLFAAVPVIVVILAFNFLGDGLRDAADPVWLNRSSRSATCTRTSSPTKAWCARWTDVVRPVSRPHARHRRRIRLRQERHRALHPAHRRAARPHRRRRDPAAPRRRPHASTW